MKAILDKFGRIVSPEQALEMKNGVLVFTGELIGDAEEAVRWDREERARKLAGGESILLVP